MTALVGAVATFLIGLGVPAPSWMQVTATTPAHRTATVQVAPDPQPKPMTPSWARCPQWWDTARAVGWPEGALGTLDYVMQRESRCNPNAYNRSGATGLTQLLGWSCPPNGCRDPWSNLAKALELWRTSGWHPWCLWHDPVTGSC